MSTANLLVLALPTLLLPVFSRLYSVTEFAQIGVFTSIVSLLTPLLSLHFQQAIPVPKETKTFQGLTQLSAWLLLLMSLLFSLLLFLFPSLFKLFDAAEVLGDFKYYLPLAFLIFGATQILSHWALFDNQKLKSLANSKSVGALTQATSRYLLPQLWQSGGLIYSFLLGGCAQILTMLKSFRLGSIQSFAELKSLAWTYRSFLGFGLPSGLLFALSTAAPVFIIAGGYGDEILGQFSMALRIGALPGFLLASALGQVYFTKCKESPTELASVTARFVSGKIKVILLGLSLAVFLVKPLGVLIIGEDWRLAVEMVFILLPAMALSFLIIPLSNLFEIGKRQDLGFWYALLALLFRITPIVIGIWLELDIYTLMIAYSIGHVLSSVAGLIITQRIVRLEWSKVLKDNTVYLLLLIFCISLYFSLFN